MNQGPWASAPTANSSAIRGVHRPLPDITLPAFPYVGCSRATWCCLRFVSISGCRDGAGAHNISARNLSTGETWNIHHRGPCAEAGRVLERVRGVAGGRQLKAALVPGDAQLLSFTWATAVPRAGMGMGALSY